MDKVKVRTKACRNLFISGFLSAITGMFINSLFNNEASSPVKDFTLCTVIIVVWGAAVIFTVRSFKQFEASQIVYGSPDRDAIDKPVGPKTMKTLMAVMCITPLTFGSGLLFLLAYNTDNPAFLGVAAALMVFFSSASLGIMSVVLKQLKERYETPTPPPAI